jgi:hypothetical protein
VIFVIYGLFYLASLLVVAIPAWSFGRKRVKWNLWDFAVVIFPFVAWWSTLCPTKSNTNVFIESLMLGGIASVASVLRVVVSERINEKALAAVLLAALCVLAAVWGPFVPEGEFLW